MRRVIAFLPWLLRGDVTCGAVIFIPWRDSRGRLNKRLRGAGATLKTILGAYRDVTGKRVTNCVVVVRASATPCWDLTAVDHETLGWLTHCAFLATVAQNDFGRHGQYVNSTHFSLIWQEFVGPIRRVALLGRRKDGTTHIGGYKHTDLIVSTPVQCHAPDTVMPDPLFLDALVDQKDNDTYDRLSRALPYFAQAYRDIDSILRRTELLLSESAIEQMLNNVGDRVDFGRKLAKLLQMWGEVTVKQARQTRASIVIYPQKGTGAVPKGPSPQDQLEWYVHRKWAEDLYDARSSAVHKGARHERGWTTHEHLVMCAIVFPLVVKLRLFQSGSGYKLSPRDLRSSLKCGHDRRSVGVRNSKRPQHGARAHEGLSRSISREANRHRRGQD